MSEHKCRCCSDDFCNIEDSKRHNHSHGHDHEHNHSHGEMKNEKYLLLVSLFVYFTLLIVDHTVDVTIPYLMKTLFLLLYFVCGFSVIKEALKSLLEKNFFNEFTLMFAATSVAIIIGQMPEAVGVMMFYRFGEYLQELASKKSKKSIKELMLSKPDTANLILNDNVKTIGVTDIKIGQKFLVKSGEKIPTDSIIVSGSSQIDTSSLTGEFMPLSVFEGDEVLGGAINIGNVLTVEAVREFKDTSISRTMELIENSSKHKAPTEKFITKFAKYYTPAVFFIALSVAIIPPLMFLQEWNVWIYRALVMLVISCPCALVISIPLSYFASIGVASKNGVLVKGGVVIDSAKDINMVVFDKTGTLTEGKLSVTQIVPNDSVSQEELLNIAVFVEQFSNHPIAKAISKLSLESIKIDDSHKVKDIGGKGLAVESGDDIYLAGTKSLLKDYGVSCKEADVKGTSVYFAKNGEYKGYITLNDSIKDNAGETIKKLKKENIKTFMLTGDNDAAADYVVSELNIDGYKASLLPQDKLSETTRLAEENNIMFIGDGVNDAPVLSAAQIGVAMGGLGSKLAIEVSDAVIINDDISKVWYIIDLAKRTKNIVWQNIIMALGVKTAFMILGVAGLSGLWEAVFADVGVSLLAIFNALRLAKK